MLFLFIGYGTKLKLIGELGERTCPRRHNTTAWRRLERYRYLSLFFVRVARWQRERLDALSSLRAHRSPGPIRQAGVRSAGRAVPRAAPLVS